MASSDDLTVVVPAYRCARYLAATVKSALAYPSASILIAEDCSGDDTLKVARSMRDAHPDRVKLLENPRNLGMTDNWQNAFGMVTTPFCLKLDGDDLISPNYIAAAMELFRRNPTLSVTGAWLKDIRDDDFLVDLPEDMPQTPENFSVLAGLDAFPLIIGWHPYPCSSTMIFRMKSWHEIGGFDRELKWCPDHEIWFRLGRRWPVAFSLNPGAWYRTLTTSVTAKHKRSDRYCYEISHMLRRAATEWREKAARQALHLAFRRNARAFFGSAGRAASAGRYREIPGRIGHGLREAFCFLTIK